MLQKVANQTLKGHKLLILTPQEQSHSSLSNLRSRFPHLQIVTRKTPFNPVSHDEIPLEKDWEDVTILMTWRCLPTIEQAPKLEVVQLLSAGADFVLEKPIFKDTNIAFCTANGIHGPQISEWVVGTFLAHRIFLPKYLEHQRDARWESLPVPDDSVGQRVGILGYGSIGRQVARVCKAMGMDVHAFTLHPRNTAESRRDDSYTPQGLGDPEGAFPSKWFSGSSKQELHEFLGSGLDIVVIAMPLTQKTKGLISHDEFEVLGRNKTFLSNVSRGQVVNTDDLIAALENDVIRGAAIDVTDPEPLPYGHRLWSTKNIIITPHISGLSNSYNERSLAVLEENLARLSEGKELMNMVSQSDGY